jgi:hypothetical protein
MATSDKRKSTTGETATTAGLVEVAQAAGKKQRKAEGGVAADEPVAQAVSKKQRKAEGGVAADESVAQAAGKKQRKAEGGVAADESVAQAAGKKQRKADSAGDDADSKAGGGGESADEPKTTHATGKSRRSSRDVSSESQSKKKSVFSLDSSSPRVKTGGAARLVSSDGPASPVAKAGGDAKKPELVANSGSCLSGGGRRRETKEMNGAPSPTAAGESSSSDAERTQSLKKKTAAGPPSSPCVSRSASVTDTPLVSFAGGGLRGALRGLSETYLACEVFPVGFFADDEDGEDEYFEERVAMKLSITGRIKTYYKGRVSYLTLMENISRMLLPLKLQYGLSFYEDISAFATRCFHFFEDLRAGKAARA